MKNINENELRNYIFKKLQESYFDELEFDDEAMKAAMSDIKASGEDFEELGASKFEKDSKFKEKFKDALKRANLELPSDEEEVKNLAKMLKKRKEHEKMFGVGSLNETEVEHIKDADGKSIKLKSSVQHKSGVNGHVERFMVGDDKNMLVKVNWTQDPGAKKLNPIVDPKTLLVKEERMEELNKSTYNSAAASSLDKGDTDLALDFLSHSNEMGIEDDKEAYEASRYMFFSNLQQIRRQAGLLLDLDEDKINEILENGHDWAQDHIATAKESIDQVFDFLMNETQSGDMWKSVDLEDREDKMEDEIEEGMGHSQTIGHGANKKPVNYPEELMRESFVNEDEHYKLSFLDKIKLKLAGVSEEKALENLNNGLPIDWAGSIEGYYEKNEPKANYSGTNEGLEEDLDKTDYGLNKAMLDYETQEDFNKEVYYVIDNDFNQKNYPDLVGKTFDTPPSYAQVKVVKQGEIELEKESSSNSLVNKHGKNAKPNVSYLDEVDELEESSSNSLANKHGQNAKPNASYLKEGQIKQIAYLQDNEANYALTLLKQDGPEEVIEYLKENNSLQNHRILSEIKNSPLDKTYEKDGYTLSWNSSVGYVKLYSKGIK